MKPTLDFYSYLQNAFDFFNEKLFSNELSPVIFTVTRKKNTAGYFREKGWVSEDGQKIHEIAINPQYFITVSPLELYQTIVHEMCHQWQYEYGKPSRKGYHNKEWGDKMRSVGLKPISRDNNQQEKENNTGVGQKVHDEPIKDGKFEKACLDFFKAGYKLAIVDSHYNDSITLKKINSVLKKRVISSSTDNINNTNGITLGDNLTKAEIIHIVGDENQQQEVVIEHNNTDDFDLTKPITDFYEVNTPAEPPPKINTKTTYKCPNCNYKLWGAFNLPVGCMQCNTTLLMIR